MGRCAGRSLDDESIGARASDVISTGCEAIGGRDRCHHYYSERQKGRVRGQLHWFSRSVNRRGVSLPRAGPDARVAEARNASLSLPQMHSTQRQESLLSDLLTDCRITITIRSMPDEVIAVCDSSGHNVHAHNCLCCAAPYSCEGPDETGFCCAVCEPCRWVELGSQLKIYREIVAELQRKRVDIAHKVGRVACENAYARRRKMKSNPNLLVAFGNVISPQIKPLICSSAQGGGSHGE